MLENARLVPDNNAYINEAREDGSGDLGGCGSAPANIIVVSNSRNERSPNPGNRVAFSARSVRSRDFLPEVAGDPGLALQAANPKISYSNHHYNVQVCD